MARKIRQIRYYGEGLNSKNYPSDVNMSKLITGTAFKNNNQNVLITQLGIQTLPGTKFYLNDSTNAIIVGNTGIYELDLEGISTINLIKFDRSSMNLINQNQEAYLIMHHGMRCFGIMLGISLGIAVPPLFFYRYRFGKS